MQFRLDETRGPQSVPRKRLVGTSATNTAKCIGGDQICCLTSSVTNSFGACTWILARQCRGFGIPKYSPTARFKSQVGVDQAWSQHWYWKVKVSYRTSSLFLSLLNCLFDGSQQRIFKDSSCASQKSYFCFSEYFVFALGVFRILDPTRLLLIVLEHASGSWVASAEDSAHRSIETMQSNSGLSWLPVGPGPKIVKI